MIDAKNVSMMSGGLVDVPEVTGSVINFRLAVDWAGQEKDSDNHSGYFHVKYFTNNDNPNVAFVKSQVDKGNFKKGSNIQLVGRALQERWETDSGEKRNRVVFVAESITYSGSNLKKDDTTATTSDESADDMVPNTF